MSHEITIRANQFAEMAYAGQGAWHGLGQQLQRGAAIEEWARAAGMDWRIQRSKVRYATAHGQADSDTLIDDQNHVLFRSDTKAPLGIVSHKFKVVQPGEVLEFFRDLVNGAGFELETAGTLFGGRRFWALANVGDSAVIGSRDKVGGYLLLSSGADGTTATTAKFTTVRVVCNNTLSMALSARDSGDVKVTHRTTFDANDVKARLGIAHGQFAKFTQAAQHLAKAHISAVDAQELTLRLLAPELNKPEVMKSPEKSRELIAKTTDGKGFKSILALFEGAALGSDMDSSRGTAWGWVNAVTQYVDYASPARNQDNRLNSAWFGAGDELKTQALESALAFI